MSEKVRVAAYARVSEATAQQQHSLEAQMLQYQKQIREHADWELVDIYADKGISGTGMLKRTEFLRMIRDCEKGKIDRILVKSVSRFSRNTLDLLRMIRQLQSMRISVWFEEQQIDSLTEEGELMLTLMASLAQAESESISENVKWSIRKNFQKGIANTKRRTFGYQWKDGKLNILPEEAETVRRIFAHFLQGGSHMRMADTLNEEGVLTARGNRFSASSISFILRNITYTGNTLLQKTYIRDPISKKKCINTGELPSYFIKDSHEAIIDMGMFERVQEKLAQRRRTGRFPYNHTGKRYPFTGKIICACCGRHYTRQLWNTSANGNKRATWICTGKRAEKYRRCDAKNITEEKLLEISRALLKRQEITVENFDQCVQSVTVQKNRTVVFQMRDETEHIQYW